MGKQTLLRPSSAFIQIADERLGIGQAGCHPCPQGRGGIAVWWRGRGYRPAFGYEELVSVGQGLAQKRHPFPPPPLPVALGGTPAIFPRFFLEWEFPDVRISDWFVN